MAYDELLAARIFGIVSSHPGFVEKKMFGGVGYLINGNMACGVNQEFLIVRVGPENYERYLFEEDTLEFDFTGRPMKGWLKVKPEAILSEQELQKWVNLGVVFAESLPPK